MNLKSGSPSSPVPGNLVIVTLLGIGITFGGFAAYLR